MLSKDLAVMEEWFRACLEGSHEFTLEGAQAFAAMLADARERAERLERFAVGFSARQSGAARIGENVVIFPRRSKTDRLITGGGGDAA